MIDKFTMNVDNNSLVMVMGSPEYVLSIKSARYKLFKYLLNFIFNED